jgi:hypothetical protein
MEDDDCKDLNCEWSLSIGTCRPGGCGEPIPFMATNVILTMDGPENYWGYHSDNRANKFQFLKDVKYCADAGFLGAYRIYGTLIDNPEEFNRAVEKKLGEENVYDHVLCAIHGFQIDPEKYFHQVNNFHDKHDKAGTNGGYLVIPVNWRNMWGMQAASYPYDRDTLAPLAGKQLADVFHAAFDSNYNSSVTLHRFVICSRRSYVRCVHSI